MFCPRIPYFTEVLGLRVIAPYWTGQGEKFHKKQILLSQERTLKRFELENGEMYFEVNLCSEIIGIHGRCDAIIDTGEQVIPIEFKVTEKVHKGHLLQLVAYALAAEEHYQRPCELGFILVGSKARAKPVEISPYLRNACFKTICDIQRVISAGYMPDSSANEHQCGQCEFLNFCNDRF